MLKLVRGISGSGKTTCLYDQLRQRAQAGQQSILLVPEQFTSSTEGRLYTRLEDRFSGLVESFSFTSLAERILDREGGAAVRTLTDAGRAVLVRQALDELQDNVHYYYRHRRSAAFCQMAAETIDELKSAGLSGQQLAQLAEGCGAGRDKLAELALIFQGYETLLQRTGMDPADRLTLAAQRLEEALSRGQTPEFLRDRAVFIDEFDTFNAPKKRLMAALLAAVPEVTVALCDDGDQLLPQDLSLFSGAKRVARDLRALARRAGVESAPDQRLRRDLRHKETPGLAAAAELAAWGTTDWPEGKPVPELRLYAAPSREEEARAAAAAIRRLMKQGIRCQKMAVVCRDPALYRAAVRYEFRMAGIPLYCDEPTTPDFSAPATAVKALLGLARGMDWCENMTTLAKTGLCSLTEEQVCALENYVYTWSPGAAEWRQKFARNPQGFGEAERITEEDEKNREAAEAARMILMDAVTKLRDRSRGCTAQQLSHALYYCLSDLGAEAQQAAQVEALRRAWGIPAAEEAAREWNVVMDLLDQMARLLGDQPIEPAEYAELFGLLLRSSDLGHIPQTLDAVIFTSAGKMRLDEPDYVFLLGMAEGEFPSAPGESGLLTHADRDALMAQQIELPDCFENRVVREQVCFYKAITAPAKGLWMSWPEGQGLSLSAALRPLCEALDPQPPETELLDMASTPAAALDCLGGGWQLTEEERAALTAALTEEEQRQPQSPALPPVCAPLPEIGEDGQLDLQMFAAAHGVGAYLSVNSGTAEGEVTKAQAYYERVGGGMNAPELTPSFAGLAVLRRMGEGMPRQIHDLAAMRAVLGPELRISPSQMEKYYICRYSYFLRYVLGLRPRKKAELSPDQSGNLVHWALQMALDPNPGPDNPCKGWTAVPFAQLTDGKLAELADLLVEEYARRNLPGSGTQFRYLLSRLKKSVTGLLCYLRDEQAQSQFKPEACELSIGHQKGSLPPQEYQLSNGRRVKLIGTVDRADTWHEEDGTRWVRVVDYKTGNKNLDLREVYCGLDCQMLLYLFSLTRDASGRFTGAEPAGVLYLLADPAPAAANRAEAARSTVYELDGLVRDEDKIFTAMDAESTGNYLPFRFVKGKPSPYQKNKRADSAKLGRIEDHLTGLVQQMGEALYSGSIEADPLCNSKIKCSWCDYRDICRHEDGVGERGLDAPAKPFEEETEPEMPK